MDTQEYMEEEQKISMAIKSVYVHHVCQKLLLLSFLGLYASALLGDDK